MSYDKDFYLSRNWRALRGSMLKHNPICAEPGCGQPSTQVDHILTRRLAPERELDRANLTCLCASHHARKSARFDGGFGNACKDEADLGCTADGVPRDPKSHWNSHNKDG